VKSEKELLSIISAHEKTAIGGDTGELASDRKDALDRYYGRLYGNEMDGRSKVISKDISDAVDWIMPSLMRIYVASDEVVRFDPVGPEDMEQAEQESDYVNHVIMKDNNGFCVIHDWFKDALLLKNGYVKRWWNEEEDISQETYENLDPESLTLLVQELESSGDTVEVVGQETRLSEAGETYDIKIKRVRKKGKVAIEPVPPEEIVVSSRTRNNLQESSFVQHVMVKTRSELVEMGLDKDFVDTLPSYGSEGLEELARNNHSEEDYLSDNPDQSMQEVEFKETFIRVDKDEDGIAELRRIAVVGGKIPEGEEWDTEIDEIPISYLTPNRMPHRHVGLSLHDELKEIAEIKTALMRGTLDNTYQLINSEWLVNERVKLSDFTQSRPNGVKRILGKEPIGDSASQVVKQPIIQHVIPVLDYLDSMKESRTGVGKNVMGLDADTLKKTTEGAARQALQQANAKIEMIARVFAETGFKDLALAVHALLIKHQNKEKVVQLRNKWVQVNPQEWKKRTDMTVSVGLGTGSQEEIRANLMLLASLQERAAQAGIVTPRNVYNLANKAANVIGFKQEGEFFSDPDSPEVRQQNQPQPQQNPLVEVENIRGQFKMQAEQMSGELKHAHEMHKMELDKYKFDKEHALNIAIEEIKAAINDVKVDLGKPGIGAEVDGNEKIFAAINELLQKSQQQPIVINNHIPKNADKVANMVRNKDGSLSARISEAQE